MITIETRRDRLRALLAERGAGMFVTSATPDLYYYGGCLDVGGYLLVGVHGQLIFITNAHDAPQAAAEMPGAEIRRFMPGESAGVLLIRALGELRGPVLSASDGIGEACEAADRELVVFPGVTANLRRVKEPGELELIRQAARIVEAGMTVIRDGLRPGVREIDVAAEAERVMRKMGAVGWSFMPKIESGPKSLMPSTYAGERVIQAGDMVLVDIAPTYRGYFGDMSRSFVAGEPTPPQRQVLEVVLAAEQAGIDAVRSGVTGGAVDDAARGPMRDAGLDDRFLHHTGHTLGLVGDSVSLLLAGQTTELLAGECVTVEPGLYVEGAGGARIEDEVLVTAEGCEVLTSFPKGLDDLILNS